MALRFAVLIGSRHFRSIISRSSASLASRSGRYLPGRGVKRRQPVAVLDQVLLPSHRIDVLKQNLDLATDQEAFEGRILDVDVRDIQFLKFACLFLDARQEYLDVGKLTLHGQGERSD